MRLNSISLLALVALWIPATCVAQEPTPGPEHAVLKQEVGRWEAKIKMWAGPGEPVESAGMEVNKMIGGFWLVSDFKGDMMGQEFQGHGTFGYDAAKKQYSGSWIDSFSPNVMHMTGNYDAATKPMTYVGEGMAPDGTAMKSKLVTVFKDDGTRHMTMHAPSPDGGDEMVKVMEIVYTKMKRESQQE